MRYIAAAIVTLAVCTPMVLADLGIVDHLTDRRGWNISATVVLVAFFWLVLTNRGER